MTLVSSLRVHVKQSGTARYERAVQRLAAAARSESATAEWRASISDGVDGFSYSFLSMAGSFAELSKRESVPALARRLFGESAGDAFLEELTASIRSSSSSIRRVRDDLSTISLPLKMNPALFFVTRLNVRSGGQATIENVIRKVTEAAQKIGEPRLVSVSSTVIGDVGEYYVGQPISDPAELDRQKSPGEVLVKAFGDKEGGAILASSAAVLERVTTMLVVPRPDLSNVRP
jgi:hypothetical protein